MQERVIADAKQYDALWSKVFDQYLFKPGYINWRNQQWIVLPEENTTFMLSDNSCWNDKQESIINSFFESLTQDELFALDWQHDSFHFYPKEHIRAGFQYHDYIRDCDVYFPSYWPDGDYHFFVDKDWKYGLFGHPWKREIKVMGHELVDLFKSQAFELGIKESKSGEGLSTKTS